MIASKAYTLLQKIWIFSENVRYFLSRLLIESGLVCAEMVRNICLLETGNLCLL